MKRVCIAFLPVVALIWVAIASAPPLANRGRKGLSAKTIDEMVELPDEETDVGLGALLIGKEYDPKVDSDKYLTELDAMALELRSRIGDEDDPVRIVSVINDYIFAERGFGYSEDDSGASDAFFLHGLLESKKGNCVSLSVLYLSLAERLDLPISGVSVPRHFFVRHHSGRAIFNIEPTCQGLPFPDSEYVREYAVSHPSAATPFHMRCLTKRETLGVVLSCLGHAFSHRGEVDGALRAWERAAAIDFGNDSVWVMLGSAYHNEGRFREAIRAYKRALSINTHDKEAAYLLGKAYAEKGQRARAVAAFKKALRVDPGFAEARYELGNVRRSQRKYDAAIVAYKRVLDIYVMDPGAGRGIARTHGPAEGPDDAAEPCRKDVQSVAELAGAWSVLAGALLPDRGARPEEVLSAYKKVAELDPDYADVNRRLAFAYYCTGQKPLARKLDPDFVPWHESPCEVEDNAESDWRNTTVLLVIASLLFALLEVRLHRLRRTRLRVRCPTVSHAGHPAGTCELHGMGQTSDC